ncbi:MAG: Dph6-related ATP pyrophosphatase [Nitrososphaerales archaeon]
MNQNKIEKALLSWSGGKDSSLSYHIAKQSKNYQIVGLLTTVTQDYQRISMHGVRRNLLQGQAKAMKLPLHEVMIPKQASNEIYEEKMKQILLELKHSKKISKVVFGDLFLQDIRAYREKFLRTLGLDCVFPLWGRDTKELAKYFFDSGFRAIICCVDPRKIGSEFCGREFDSKFLSELPRTADPCGENGEFHTFVYDGPIFADKIDVKVVAVVERDGFYFADILPA